MAGRAPQTRNLRNEPVDAASAQLPGRDRVVEPDDRGLSLDELSQAYAALLAKGDDPYPDATLEDSAPSVEATTEDEAASTTTEATFDVTPRSILESILFVGHPTGEPLTSERIAALMRGVQPSEIDDLVQELNAEYDAYHAPYCIASVGPGYRLALRPEFGALRDAFHGRIREARLSQAAIDVLAIVGYHQPISADAIERLRGKPSGAILSQLLRRDLLSLTRPAERKAKPVYRTTSRFLELFGLQDLKELPRSQEVERDL
jgi:segregation and condensation protein B